MTAMTSAISLFGLLSLAALALANVELHSPRRTNWGVWRGWNHCPHGQYAAGIQIKAERWQHEGDDTGLNAVALYCRPYPSDSTDKRTYIMSGEGQWGDWQAVKWCPPGDAIIGFNLRSEGEQGKGDDVAADNFRATCGSLNGPRNPSSNSIQGDTQGWGDWTAAQFCPSGFLVCGINTQIEPPQGDGDDTSLNNVDLDCCKGSSDNYYGTPAYKGAGMESDWANGTDPVSSGAGLESDWAVEETKSDKAVYDSLLKMFLKKRHQNKVDSKATSEN